MGSVETRSRKSTLSKIGKIFGVDKHEHSSYQPPPELSDKVSNQKTPEDNQTCSGNVSNSQSSSLNSSTSSLHQIVEQPSSPKLQSKPNSTTPSRAPSLRNTNNNNNKDDKIRSVLGNNSSEKVTLDRSTSNVSNPNLKNLPRFIVYDDGTHEHHLKNAKRQEKLSIMLKNLWGGQKLRNEAVSAVPEILSNNPPTLFSGLVKQMSHHKDEQDYPISGATKVNGITSTTSIATASNKTFAERYGRCQEVVGKGTFGVVRISHKKENECEKLFAVKEFKRRPNETDQKYSRRLTSEFCISSSLKHVNIIETLDLLQDAKGDYVEVMEFCSGGDLYTLIIAAGKLEYMEADCYFKQLIRGVNYMHEMGVAHRDLKPENLLLTSDGVLKITDFGNGECFRMAWEKDIHLSGGICGSSPYIAPEEYNSKEFDPRSVDIWSCGVIYMAMRTGRHLWRTATDEDEFYLKYLEGRKSSEGYEPIEMLKRARCRNVIYSILDPKPKRRINGKQILNSEWGREIKCCTSAC